MKTKNKINNGIIVGAILAAGVMNANADSAFRFKSGYDLKTGDVENVLGVAETDGGINHSTRFTEYLKVKSRYGDEGFSGVFNWRLPSMKLGDWNNTFVLKGDSEGGFGIDTKHQRGGFALQLNADKGSIANRFGADVEYDFGKLTIGGAYDSVSGENGFNQTLLRGIYDIDSNNQVGAGYVTRNNGLDSVSGYWVHHGADQSWGTRNRFKYDMTDSGDKLGIESIWVQNPDDFMLNEHAGHWSIERDSGDMYNVGTVESLLYNNGINLSQRTTGGIVSRFAYDGDGEVTDLEGEVGYTWNLGGRDKFGFTGLYGENSERGSRYGAGVYYEDNGFRIIGKAINEESQGLGGMVSAEYSF